MITCLFFATAIITYFAYQNSKLKLLSPTFWSSGMFMSFSFIYASTIFAMKSDISFVTLLVILGFLIITASGEYLANRIRYGKNCKDFNALGWNKLLWDHKYSKMENHCFNHFVFGSCY